MASKKLRFPFTSSEDLNAWLSRISESLDKKYYAQGLKRYVLRKRVLNIVTAVEEKLLGIPEEKLRLSLQILCDETDYSEFPTRFEKLMLTARRDPNSFADDLFATFMKLGAYVRENKLFRLYYEFVAYVADHCLTDNDSERRTVWAAYLDLLLEATEFLKDDCYDYNKLICGLTTDDQLLLADDPFPDSDVPGYELEHEARTRTLRPGEGYGLLRGFYAKHGYNVSSFDDAEQIRTESGNYQVNINLMVPFITEYTVDMLPKTPLCTDSRRYRSFPKLRAMVTQSTAETDDQIRAFRKQLDADMLISYLYHRRRMIPANGIRVQFDGSKAFQSLTLKEFWHNGTILLLWRLNTTLGDISGRYNTRTGIFTSPLSTANGISETNELIRSVVLWCYTAAVCNVDGILPTTQCYQAFVDDPAQVQFVSLGTKQSVPGAHVGEGTSRILNPERYRVAESNINGYIRRLPEGQKASERARQIAEAMGYDLADNETYVQPFVRATWVLRELKDDN